MANTDFPFGATVVGRQGGGNPVTHRWGKDASAGRIGFGDFVKLEADGKIAPAAAGDRLLGVCVQQSSASLAEDVLICDDPAAIFEIQDDGDAATLAATSVGLNFDIIATTLNTTTGRSKHELDASGGQTTTAQLRLRGLSGVVGNEWGKYAKLLVTINEHEFQIGGTGV